MTKVVDFGLARSLAADTQLTQQGMFVGTPAYMAPEQWMGQEADARSDLYSLICAYYHLLTGKAPYKAATSVALGYQYRYEPFPDARQLAPDLPQAVCRVLARGAAKEPEKRYQSAVELVAEMESLLAAPDEDLGMEDLWGEIGWLGQSVGGWGIAAVPQQRAEVAPQRESYRAPVSPAPLGHRCAMPQPPRGTVPEAPAACPQRSNARPSRLPGAEGNRLRPGQRREAGDGPGSRGRVPHGLARFGKRAILGRRPAAPGADQQAVLPGQVPGNARAVGSGDGKGSKLPREKQRDGKTLRCFGFGARHPQLL